MKKSCYIEKMEGFIRPKSKPKQVLRKTTFEKCTEVCINDENCNSFVLQHYVYKYPNYTYLNCYLNKERFLGSEPIYKKTTRLYTAYKICTKGIYNIITHFGFINYNQFKHSENIRNRYMQF